MQISGCWLRFCFRWTTRWSCYKTRGRRCSSSTTCTIGCTTTCPTRLNCPTDRWKILVTSYHSQVEDAEKGRHCLQLSFSFWNRSWLSNIYPITRKACNWCFCVCRSSSCWAWPCWECPRWPRSSSRSRTTSSSSASTPRTMSAWNSSSYSMQVNVKKVLQHEIDDIDSWLQTVQIYR